MDRLRELLDGLLLGDGNIQFRSQGARYVHSCKHKEYLEWLRAELESLGLTFTPKIYEKPNGYGIGVTYRIYSHIDDILLVQYQRWYVDRKKIVPRDIVLTPSVLKHWYIGDGTFDSAQGYLQCISIASHSFSFEDRQLLVEQLSEMGFRARNDKRGTIRILKSSIADFLGFIGECPVECYTYKWDTQRFSAKYPYPKKLVSR